jgi:hypothetical protein
MAGARHGMCELAFRHLVNEEALAHWRAVAQKEKKQIKQYRYIFSKSIVPNMKEKIKQAILYR